MSTVDGADVALWMAWKRVGEVTRARVLADVTAHSSVSESELTVLVHLERAGGTSRQNALASAAGWDRTRLSHLLTRMDERGYLARHRLQNGVELTLLDAGREALEATREPLGEAVQRHVMSRLDLRLKAALREITEALTE
jgi:DNA-binding MarR family transcriptional regulator